jgi:hypothetical protein
VVWHNGAGGAAGWNRCQRAEIAEQLASAGEQHGMAIDHRLMGNVLGKHRLADAVRPDKHDVGGCRNAATN